MAFEYLEKPTQQVWEDLGIENIIIDHNRGGDENEYTHPVSHRDVGKVLKPKTGWGAVLNVQVKTKRDVVGTKIFNEIKDKSEEVRKVFLEAFQDNDRNVEIEDFVYVRDTTWSDGARTIMMNMWPLDKDNNRSKFPQRFVIALKGLKNDSADPHEVMTAALILGGKVINVQNINRLNSPADRERAINNVTIQASQLAERVHGNKEKEIAAIRGDFVNLAKALSVSNYVVNLLVNKYRYTISNVYQTGAAWQRKVKPFEGYDRKNLQTQDYVIKAYNSADLIIEFGNRKVTHFWGLSLKKKGIGRNEPDPTLLNKPVTGTGSFKKETGKGTRDGYLTYKLASDPLAAQLIRSEEEFWKGVYLVKFGRAATGQKSSWLKQLDGALSGDEKNAALTGKRYRRKQYPPNTYFMKIDEAFRKVFAVPSNFREFLDIVFRINIDSYVDKKQFHFSLITGSGDLRPNGTLQVNTANEKSSVLMNEVFAKLFGREGITDKDYIIEQTRGKAQAFDQNANAAKLFYTMAIGRTGRKLEICDLEVRYKGAITNNPQFQVFITTKFRRYLAMAKSRLGSMHGFDPMFGR